MPREHHDPYPDLPVDPDVTASEAGRPALPAGRDVLGVIAVGGSLGSLARWGLADAFPHPTDHLAWGTILANIAGSFLIGVLMVLVTERWPDRRLVRPFLGVGVLGGFTTFSTYELDTRDLLAAARPGLAAAYLFGTLALGLLAVIAGISLTERAVR
jgi:CrcB protein